MFQGERYAPVIGMPESDQPEVTRVTREMTDDHPIRGRLLRPRPQQSTPRSERQRARAKTVQSDGGRGGNHGAEKRPPKRALVPAAYDQPGPSGESPYPRQASSTPSSSGESEELSEPDPDTSDEWLPSGLERSGRGSSPDGRARRKGGKS